MDWKLISPDVLRQCQTIHEDKKLKWGNDGWRRATIVRDFADDLGAKSVLDYGCGRGTLRAALGTGGKKIRGMGWPYPCHEYDPAIRKKSQPRSADLVACTDVMEHVETPLVQNVLRHVRKLGRFGAFFLISTRLANQLLPDGRNAHLTVQTAEWWEREILHAGFRVTRKEVQSNLAMFWCLK